MSCTWRTRHYFLDPEDIARTLSSEPADAENIGWRRSSTDQTTAIVVPMHMLNRSFHSQSPTSTCALFHAFPSARMASPTEVKTPFWRLSQTLWFFGSRARTRERSRLGPVVNERARRGASDGPHGVQRHADGGRPGRAVFFHPRRSVSPLCCVHATKQHTLAL